MKIRTRNKNRKRSHLFLILCGICCLLAAGTMGCYSVEPLSEKDAENGQDKIQVLCTTFPLYDWTRQVAGGADTVEVSLLLDGGVDMHSYQASAADIAKISSCDMLVYVGGVSDQWLIDMLKNHAGKDTVLVNLTEVLEEHVREEELVEGMQESHENGETDGEYDEHVWLSLNNAVISCGAVRDGLCAIDAENAQFYEARCREYTDKLLELDKEYRDMVENAKRDTVLFADRFPFLYLMKDYDIRYYAAFPGCSSETAASFETVAFLAEKLKEERLGCVLTIENAENGPALELARTIIENAGVQAKVLSMDSMQSAAKKQIDDGMTYYSVMEQNLSVLKEAMNE